MDASDTYQLIILIILLALSAFFSSNETALMAVNKIRLRALADEGNKRAAKVLDIVENHTPKMLSAILIGNNLVNITASSLATSLAYSFGGYMVSIATAALTVAILIFGEITPKNYATLNAEKITLRYIPILSFFMMIMTPFIFIINMVSRVFMKLLRVDPDAANKAMTEEELRTIVDVSHEDGVIESDEKKMIYNVFDLGDADAKDIMVPRVNVSFADVDSTYDELIDIFREDRFTRLPVYENTQDNIVGIINMKDLLLYDSTKPFNIRDYLRKPHFTYEYKDISELLVEMRESTFNIAIVLDEYGEMTGLITLEDILEEIVGEIHDEYDDDEKTYRRLNNNTYVFDGKTLLSDFSRILNIPDDTFSDIEGEADTLAGLVLEMKGDFPKVHEKFEYSNFIFEVLEISERRISSVKVTIRDSKS